MNNTSTSGSDLPRVNFQVTEIWEMTCPFCNRDQKAPFNKENPMRPMKVSCDDCTSDFILTYERED